MVKILSRKIDWLGVLTLLFGAAVIIPSLIALFIAIGTVVLEIL